VIKQDRSEHHRNKLDTRTNGTGTIGQRKTFLFTIWLSIHLAAHLAIFPVLFSLFAFKAWI